MGLLILCMPLSQWGSVDFLTLWRSVACGSMSRPSQPLSLIHWSIRLWLILYLINFLLQNPEVLDPLPILSRFFMTLIMQVSCSALRRMIDMWKYCSCSKHCRYQCWSLQCGTECFTSHRWILQQWPVSAAPVGTLIALDTPCCQVSMSRPSKGGHCFCENLGSFSVITICRMLWSVALHWTSALTCNLTNIGNRVCIVEKHLAPLHASVHLKSSII